MSSCYVDQQHLIKVKRNPNKLNNFPIVTLFGGRVFGFSSNYNQPHTHLLHAAFQHLLYYHVFFDHPLNDLALK